MEFAKKIEELLNTLESTSRKVVKVENAFKEEFAENWEERLINFAKATIVAQAEQWSLNRFDARNAYYANVSHHLMDNFTINVDNEEDKELGEFFIRTTHRYLIKEYFDTIFKMPRFKEYKDFLDSKSYVKIFENYYIPYEEFKAKYVVY